ncbi:hypothetical protein TNCV_3575921 [Trichonephila clavipes]|nr:hypothetical protein TNCV_3575921 [Trichonephila clavipes]
MVKEVPAHIDNRLSLSVHQVRRLGDLRENGLWIKGGVMNKMYRCWTSRLAPLHSPRARENRNLERPEERRRPRKRLESGYQERPDSESQGDLRGKERRRTLMALENCPKQCFRKNGQVPFGQRIEVFDFP